MGSGTHAKSAGRHVDVSVLPAGVVALIDALGAGESLTVTRDGRRIATIEAEPAALDGTIVQAESSRDDDDASTEDARANAGATVVASALKLSPYVRRLLSDELGEDYVVLDFTAAPPTADVLLVQPFSLQLIGILQEKFPAARVMIVEIEDDDLGVSGQGPVRRLMNAGAETYLVSNTVSGLATQLEQAITLRPQLEGGVRARLQIDSAAEAEPDMP